MLGRILVETDGSTSSSAVLAVASIDWSTVKRELAVIGSPAYNQVVVQAELGGADQAGARPDLLELVHDLDLDAAHDAVASMLAGEVARILKIPASEISPQRPLAELGMDSLMSLELRLGVERHMGLEIALPPISETTTLASVARAIVARINDPVRKGEARQDQREAEVDLVRRHASETVTMDDLAELSEIVRSTNRAERG
jgi:acyl carrier protein